MRELESRTSPQSAFPEKRPFEVSAYLYDSSKLKPLKEKLNAPRVFRDGLARASSLNLPLKNSPLHRLSCKDSPFPETSPLRLRRTGAFASITAGMENEPVKSPRPFSVKFIVAEQSCPPASCRFAAHTVNSAPEKAIPLMRTAALRHRLPNALAGFLWNAAMLNNR